MSKLGTLIKRLMAKALREPTLAGIINEGVDIPGVDEGLELEIIRQVLEKTANHFDPDVV